MMMVFLKMCVQHCAIMIILLHGTSGYLPPHDICKYTHFHLCHWHSCPPRPGNEDIKKRNKSITEDFTIQAFAYCNQTSDVELLLCKCELDAVSADAFFCLSSVVMLDISMNRLQKIPYGTLQPLTSLKGLNAAGM